MTGQRTASAVHTVIVCLPIAKPDCYGRVFGTVGSPACIHLERKWTNVAALQSFTITAASAASLRGTDVWADVPSAWGFILVERVTVYKLTLHR